jgi:hypothetical protein
VRREGFFRRAASYRLSTLMKTLAEDEVAVIACLRTTRKTPKLAGKLAHLTEPI